MKIWVLWEDQRAPGKEFGPDLLLKSCVADDRQEAPFTPVWWRAIEPLPQKGKEKLLAALQEELEDLRQVGPVLAVLDRDKAHELCQLKAKPLCRTELLGPLRLKAPGEYELVLLEQNVESLWAACCRVLGRVLPSAKPKPGERDEVLRKLAFQPGSEQRKRVRAEVPSFDRLVRKVGELVAEF